MDQRSDSDYRARVPQFAGLTFLATGICCAWSLPRLMTTQASGSRQGGPEGPSEGGRGRRCSAQARRVRWRRCRGVAVWWAVADGLAVGQRRPRQVVGKYWCTGIRLASIVRCVDGFVGIKASYTNFQPWQLVLLAPSLFGLVEKRGQCTILTHLVISRRLVASRQAQEAVNR